jgi:hypothetical protein
MAWQRRMTIPERSDMGKPVPCPGPGASCVRDVSGHMLQTRWTAGRVRACVRLGVLDGQVGFGSPMASLSNSPLLDQGLAAHQHLTRSTVHQSRWIAGAADVNGYLPEHSPRVRLVIKKPYWLIGAIPTLYAAALRRVVYRCRLNKYLEVPARTQDPPATVCCAELTLLLHHAWPVSRC